MSKKKFIIRKVSENKVTSAAFTAMTVLSPAQAQWKSAPKPVSGYENPHTKARVEKWVDLWT
jgi:hypothetical protein